MFVSEKVLIEEVADGNMSRKEAEAVIDSADIHFIRDDEDPRPYRHFLKVMHSL
jgi:hypothetical protein